MRVKLLSMLLALILIGSSGCASGPIGRFFRGGACNTCMPARPGLFNWRGNSATLCESPACQGQGHMMDGSIGDYSGGASSGYGIDPFGSSAPVYAPITPPNTGRLPGPTGGN
ncbi:MAG TPA: hypothetical protein PKD54_14155 [Pirellulaceae bacterium]|nr:hypothetical protein [Pirellulaceae bacterium]